jgi:hypothetical protein
MVQDRYFYDPVAGNYTVDRYVDDLEKRYGGIDSVLIWPTHPNMGIDNRNQHDLIRSMPGGVAGVRQMIADFHRRGVRVLLPMMMWDQEDTTAGAVLVGRDCQPHGPDRCGRHQRRHTRRRAPGILAGRGQNRPRTRFRTRERSIGGSARLEPDDMGSI